MKRATIGLWIALWAPVASFGAQSIFDPQSNTWTITNGSVYAVFQLTPDAHFLVKEVSELNSGDRWIASPTTASTPIRLQVGDQVFDAQTQYSLVSQSLQSGSPSGIRQSIVLQDLKGTAQLTLTLKVYDDQP